MPPAFRSTIRCQSEIPQPAKTAVVDGLLKIKSAWTSYSKYTAEYTDYNLNPDRVATESRTLLRTLLRESSYLPDPKARVYTKQHILHRFRAYHPRLVNGKGTATVLQPDKLSSLRRDGWRAVRKMHRANQGYRDDLFSVMLKAYGRTGKGKHELMKPLLFQPTEGFKPATDMLSHLKGRANIPEHVYNALPRPTPMLEALIKSQSTRPASNVLSPQIKRGGKFEIPELNAWKRSLPVKRVVNHVKNHYASLLGKALPPLPLDEWDHLKNLADGKVKWTGSIQRRRKAEGFGNDLHKQDLKFLAKIPPEDESERGSSQKPHILTQRFMQRLYADVFELCPRMEFTNNQKWRVVWGEPYEEAKIKLTAMRNSSLSTFSEASDLGLSHAIRSAAPT